MNSKIVDPSTFPAFMASFFNNLGGGLQFAAEFCETHRETILTHFVEGAPGWASAVAIDSFVSGDDAVIDWRPHAGAVTDPSSREPYTGRYKTSHVGVPALFELTRGCHLITRGWGNHTCYHVGSSLDRPDWRDVDIVMMLPDEVFKREFPNAPLHSAAWEHDAKWLVTTIALSKWLTERSGVQVDFKFQPVTFANDKHDGPRNPIGRLYKMEGETDDED